MAILRFSPVGDLLKLQDRMNRIFSELSAAPRGYEEIHPGSWAPPVDIYETGDELVLKVDIPEVDKKDVGLKIEDNVLIIAGERVREKEVKEEQYHRAERTYGSFTRSFSLPPTIDQAAIKASFKNGVLTIVMPKKEERKPKEVTIEVR